MTRRLAELGPQARTDLYNIASYIAQDNPRAATSFLEAVERTLDHLVLNPEMGRIRIFRDSRLGPCRAFFVKGFPKYLIFYQTLCLNADDVNDLTFLVLRVLHAARDIDAVL